MRRTTLVACPNSSRKSPAQLNATRIRKIQVLGYIDHVCFTNCKPEIFQWTAMCNSVSRALILTQSNSYSSAVSSNGMRSRSQVVCTRAILPVWYSPTCFSHARPAMCPGFSELLALSLDGFLTRSNVFWLSFVHSHTLFALPSCFT